jgi:hypothetical protein
MDLVMHFSMPALPAAGLTGGTLDDGRRITALVTVLVR